MNQSFTARVLIADARAFGPKTGSFTGNREEQRPPPKRRGEQTVEKECSVSSRRGPQHRA
jgi:hypothetical protein